MSSDDWLSRSSSPCETWRRPRCQIFISLRWIRMTAFLYFTVFQSATFLFYYLLANGFICFYYRKREVDLELHRTSKCVTPWRVFAYRVCPLRMTKHEMLRGQRQKCATSRCVSGSSFSHHAEEVFLYFPIFFPFHRITSETNFVVVMRQMWVFCRQMYMLRVQKKFGGSFHWSVLMMFG